LNLPKKLENLEQIDVAIDYLTLLQEVFKQIIELTTRPDTKQNLPKNSQQKITHKRRLRNLWQKSRDSKIKTVFNRQTALMKILMNLQREEEWTNFLGKIDRSMSS